jgi:hypothetical protein
VSERGGHACCVWWVVEGFLSQCGGAAARRHYKRLYDCKECNLCVHSHFAPKCTQCKAQEEEDRESYAFAAEFAASVLETVMAYAPLEEENLKPEEEAEALFPSAAASADDAPMIGARVYVDLPF